MKFKTLIFLVVVIVNSCSIDFSSPNDDKKGLRPFKIEIIKSDTSIVEEGSYSLMKYDSNGNIVEHSNYSSDDIVISEGILTYNSDNNVVISERVHPYGSYRTEYFYNSDGTLDYELEYIDEVLEEKIVYKYQDGLKTELNIYSDLSCTDLTLYVEFSYRDRLISSIDIYDVFLDSTYLENSIDVKYSNGRIVSISDSYGDQTFTYSDDNLVLIEEVSDGDKTTQTLLYSNGELDKIITKSESSIMPYYFEQKIYYESGPSNSLDIQENMVYGKLEYY